ncbi:amidohydrolase family protein [Hyphococcus sp.]|uniref:amidohydrolase family protein n=1 Tax=Hyphococcus sp. TaxID=2038636 RepID=UPI0035C6E1A0
MSAASETFEKTPGWLDWFDGPSKPKFTPPPGAVDAHCHVFGPGHKFPFAPERKYTPCDASKHQLYALRDHLGFSRNVLVQATCHGADNRATMDAVMSAKGKAKGIASVKPSVTDEELELLNANGIKGVRFNFVKRLVDPLPPAVLAKLVERINKFGWHIVIYFEAPDLPELYDFISDISTTVVIDHMGRPDVTKDVDGAEFSLFQKLMEENEHIWSKVTCPERLSKSGPPAYDDFVPFGRRIVERFPDRVLWGTDWPHPNLKSHMPDDAWLVDMIPRIAPTEALQQKLLVDNPMRLYWPEEGK